MEAHEELLYEEPEDWTTLEDLTRSYKRARYVHIRQLAKIKTYDSVVSQLEHVMECSRQCSRDDHCVRNMAPHLLLRLNRDQEAYDFLKWCGTKGSNQGYTSIDTSRCFEDVKSANCFEDVDYMCGEGVHLSDIVAMVLLKVKILLDLISLQESVEAREVPKNIPAEIYNCIRYYSVRSPVCRSNKEIMEAEDQRDLISELVKQVKTLYNVVDKKNIHFWPALLYPGKKIEASPEFYTCNEVSEVERTLKFTYDSWIETAGAIEVVRGMIQAKTLGRDDSSSHPASVPS